MSPLLEGERDDYPIEVGGSEVNRYLSLIWQGRGIKRPRTPGSQSGLSSNTLLGANIAAGVAVFYRTSSCAPQTSLLRLGLCMVDCCSRGCNLQDVM